MASLSPSNTNDNREESSHGALEDILNTLADGVPLPELPPLPQLGPSEQPIDHSREPDSTPPSQEQAALTIVTQTGTINLLEESQESVTLPPGPSLLQRDLPLPAPKATRNRYRYSNLRILADCRLFVDEDQRRPYLNWKESLPDDVEEDTERFRIRGTISACPRKNNGWNYAIDWHAGDLDKLGCPVAYVRTTINRGKGDTVNRLLREAASEHAMHFGEQAARTSRRQKVTRASNGAPVAVRETNSTQSQQTPRARKAPPLTPPTAERAQGAADVATVVFASGDHQSISTLGTRPTPESAIRMPPTRLRMSGHESPLISDSENEEERVGDDFNQRTYRPADPLDDEHVADNSSSDTDEDNDGEGESRPVVDDPKTLYEKVSNMKWKFEEVRDPPKGECLKEPRKEWYRGKEGLRPKAGKRFHDPFDCFTKVSGLDRAHVARICRNTNNYYHSIIKNKTSRVQGNGRYNGMLWKDVTVTEMYRFFGILLKISMNYRDSGGYTSYFSDKNKFVHAGDGITPMEIVGTAGIIRRYMSLKRFKQIRGAFHPEEKKIGEGGDKCYQLRFAINSFNNAAMSFFEVPRDLTFDEGGCGCRSRFCPVRQYNKDKPQKYRVDFYILSDARRYNILHLDVYQGKNANNINIHPAIQDLPTTQKAVANSLHSTGLHEETQGMHCLSMDNRYQCPELAMICRDKYNCYSSGTTRQNRKGWDKQQMNIKKEKNRGTTKVLYDKVHRVITGQWIDSKCVSFTSTLNDVGMGVVKRRVGPDIIEVDCPRSLIKYQEDMGAVDRGDQQRAHGGGFSTWRWFLYKGSLQEVV